MAELSTPQLQYNSGCLDCGVREIEPPAVLPDVGDDFEWRQRDFDGFRAAMLEELAARFPERGRWTPADLEIVLVEVLAAALDQLSDMVDRVAAESYLETARQPESVYQLLKMIGYDAAGSVGTNSSPDEDDISWQRLKKQWQQQPSLMEAARRAGPLAIRHQRRMVTLNDYSTRLREHPLVVRARAFMKWGGSWPVLRVVVTLWRDESLDNSPFDRVEYTPEIVANVNEFHRSLGLRQPDWARQPAIRTVLKTYIDAYRMAGQEVVLQDVQAVGISMALSILVNENYFQTEVRQAVDEVLGRGPDGFFSPGRLAFSEDLYASDIFEALMKLDGVENVCLNRFKRVGKQYPDQTASGKINLKDLEIAVCNNDTENPQRGYYTLIFHGGRKG